MSRLKYFIKVSSLVLSLAVGLMSIKFTSPAKAQADDPSPPTEIVKLIFIHHSTGENWLTDGYGNLGAELGANHYFVSDTNYGWGPDAIGDRTDILNWTEWFRSSNTPTFMQALFVENGQNSSYTRTLQDPGGENQIIMFKSCFPNSALEGNPNDPPAPGDGLTVSNSKFIYNNLLQYFATRPDKLFVVITAPPLSDQTYAANARAFNNWLMQNWLSDNQYPYNNVVVFDFFNVLTDPNNHHRFKDGQIDYINSAGSSTLAYPSDDDHPNPTGSQKATAEFIPLLNVYYHRWKAGAPPSAPVQTTQQEVPNQPAQVGGETQPEGVAVLVGSDLIDDFEGNPSAGSSGWQAYRDETAQTTITCIPESGYSNQGNRSLHLNYNVQANSWATCALIYNNSQNWQNTQGLSFYVHASQPALLFNIDAYGGAPGEMTTYIYTVETTPEMASGWVNITIPWNSILRASWEANAGSPFSPNQVLGIAIGFDTLPDAPNTGELWIDDIHLITTETIAAATTAPIEQPVQESQEEPAPSNEPEPSRRGLPFCRGQIALSLLVIVAAVWLKRTQS